MQNTETSKLIITLTEDLQLVADANSFILQERYFSKKHKEYMWRSCGYFMHISEALIATVESRLKSELGKVDLVTALRYMGKIRDEMREMLKQAGCELCVR